MSNVFASWQAWALLSAIFAALTAIFAKVGVQTMDSDLATFLRTIVILASLTLFLLITGRLQLQPLQGKAITFLVLSGLATGASWLCYFRALRIGQAAEVAPVDKLSVVFVALFGVIFLGEHLSLRAWLGIVLITSGVVLIALRPT